MLSRIRIAHDGPALRRLAYWGARYGPAFWVKHSPAFFGVAFALALPAQRHKVQRSLRLARGPVGPAQERFETLATFVRYAQCLAEGLAVERKEALNAQHRVINEDTLQAALAQGRGLVITTAHAGPWDAAAQLLYRALGREVLVVMVGERDARARELHDAVRARSGVRIIHVGEHPLDALPVLHALRGGAVVAVQLDRGAPSGRGIDVQLFGGAAQVPEGPFRLAALSGAPIVPLFVRRRAAFNYEFEVHPVIQLPRGASPTELGAAAQRAVDAMAEFIRSEPTQWFDF
ncbi:MAG TPA: lysophospholipid acyltransferase family protein [Polyangiaceae bacterium]|nr:lysophospholipid acyltransferase family protein [Polyangiaceae bacterium]